MIYTVFTVFFSELPGIRRDQKSAGRRRAQGSNQPGRVHACSSRDPARVVGAGLRLQGAQADLLHQACARKGAKF